MSIKKLDGKVIHSPLNIVKELVENSLDANATSINIQIKDGEFNDLDLLCERHCTSKISNIHDLNRINSFGFRGEALASVSSVSFVSVTSKPQSQEFGARATYKNCKLVEKKYCASNNGTLIMKTTPKAFSDEYQNIISFIQKMSILHFNVSFSCKKHNSTTNDFISFNASSVVKSIENVYSSSLSSFLKVIDVTNEEFDICGSVIASMVSYQAKKFTMILFINVENKKLAKKIQNLYSTLLLKGTHPWVFVDIKLPPNKIDVNMHPSKEQRQEEIVDFIVEKIQSTLSMNETSSVFSVQKPNNFKSPTTSSQPSSQSSYPFQTVRTDPKAKSLLSFFKVDKEKKESTNIKNLNVVNTNSNANNEMSQEVIPDKLLVDNSEILNEREGIKNTEGSLIDLSQSVKESNGQRLDESNILNNEDRPYIKVQFTSIKELMAEATKNYIIPDFLYQSILFNFANFGVIQLQSPIKVEEILNLAFKVEEFEVFVISTYNLDIPAIDIIGQARLLDEYFQLNVNDSKLYTIPLVVANYIPPLSKIPKFMIDLCYSVDWNNEKYCFKKISMLLKDLYSPEIKIDAAGEDHGNLKWQIEHAFLPSLKEKFYKPQVQDAHTIVTDLHDLYKVFERC
ncbi:DNA mismatch repair protein Mlh1 domain-containing protein [Rozella allomycis CSF55]|uniref:DNA mismatch repair protein Mlh1 domain-containing protein n=1 Tax=Rozella allomycis (strain CSF55) TaxID=988480 RepID=A0A075B2I4_ROZAC|nr:DNA mismatch repair protein Mlh1 domain-containing protein [Rozella allomycis CSF55]|eukprot:EPZ36762.1 DNA mismatch repair protein Mlh1 domain-containing protein [Rozella allomycis CSF55]